MTEAIDMSLDDIIKNNKKSRGTDTNARSNGGGRGRGGGRGFESRPGPTRSFDNRFTSRINPYFVPQAVHMQEMLVGGESNSETGTKLYISNLDEAVTNEDIKVLFSDVGELKRYSIHYDRSGRSKGTAEVEYMRQLDAVAAMKRYNNVQLDGKPMKLEVVGLKIMTPVPMPPMPKGIFGNSFNASSSFGGRIVGRGQYRGGGGGFGGGGGGGGWKRGSGRSGGGGGRPKKVSAEDLDADLEKYRLEALHIK